MITVSTDQVRDFILHVLADQMSLPIDRDTVDEETSLGPEGLDLASLDLVELTLAVEMEYSVKIPDDELEDLSHLGLGAFVANITARIS
jgi:acyl carrier protein